MFDKFFGKDKTPSPPPSPPKPRVFDMENIFDVIEYCILHTPEEATDIITAFLNEHPDQINKRFTDDTKPQDRSCLAWYVKQDATPLMVLMKCNNLKGIGDHDYTADGSRISGEFSIFEDELFDNLITLGADLDAKDNDGKTALFYTEIETKNIAQKLLENGTEYHSFFNGEDRSISSNYDNQVHFSILDYESGKFRKHTDKIVALSHIFYTTKEFYEPRNQSNGFHRDGNDGYYISKRLLFDFAQKAIHIQHGDSSSINQGRVFDWRTVDIESFDTTSLNQELINRARAFMESDLDIETPAKQEPKAARNGIPLSDQKIR